MRKNVRKETILAKDILHPEYEVFFAYCDEQTMSTTSHMHDFYEFFLVTSGELIHCVNGWKQELKEGDLVFIRPNDVHYYELKDESAKSTFVNVAFAEENVSALLAYLGSDFPMSCIINGNTPPTVRLGATQKHEIETKLGRLNFLPVENRNEWKYIIKTVLVDFFVGYTFGRKKEKEKLPLWIEDILSFVQTKDALEADVSQLVQMSGKSHEYVSRALKKHVGKTPTQLLNDARLNFAANLLISSDMQVVQICYECGYNNLSHFNHLFKKKYGVSPKEYRTENKSHSYRM